MKVLIIIFCLTSTSAFAQSDTVNSKIERITFNSSAITRPKPMIILNGTVFKGNFDQINPDSIMDVQILKGKNATALYGAKAINGVVIIRTKGYKKSDIADKAKSLDSVVSKDALFVIDGKPSKNKLNDINPDDIVSINILKKGSADLSFEPVNDIVVIVTKKNAITQYQKRFSAFSNSYKDYLDAHQNNDEEFLYVVDGIQLQGKRNDIIRTLYATLPEKIKEIGFNPKQAANGSITMVIINTKQ